MPKDTTMQPTEALVKGIEDLRSELGERDKTTGDRLTAMEAAMVDVKAGLDNSKRAAIFPEMDPRLLKYGAATPEARKKSWDRLMGSKPIGGGVSKALVEDLQRKNDEVLMLDMIRKGMTMAGLAAPGSMGELKAFGEFQELTGDLSKALDAATTGEGLEWVPTGFSQQLRERIILEMRVAALFDEINMPTNPFTWPFTAARPLAQVVAEGLTTVNPYALTDGMRTFTGATPTGNMTFTARKMRALEIYTREWDEDTIAASLGWLNRQMSQAIADGWEDAIQNGDTDGTHIDADVGASTTDIKVFADGLREHCITHGGVSTDSGAGALTILDLRLLRQAMGVFGVRLRSLAWIVSMQSYFQMLQLANHQTLADLGPQAHLLSGQVGSVDDIPVILSEFARADLNASGVEDGITTNLANVLLVHRDNWMRGRRPGLGVETERLTPTDQGLLVAFERGTFDHVDGDVTSVGHLYNIPVIA